MTEYVECSECDGPVYKDREYGEGGHRVTKDEAEYDGFAVCSRCIHMEDILSRY